MINVQELRIAVNILSAIRVMANNLPDIETLHSWCRELDIIRGDDPCENTIPAQYEAKVQGEGTNE